MFKIILTNDTEDAELIFKVKDTLIAKKWFAELSKNYPIYEDDRFSSWNTDYNLIEDLNQQIGIINAYDNIIDRNASVTITQCDLNYLHKFFEDLRGDDIIGSTPWFRQAPTEVKIALEKYNVLIHLLEEQLRSTDHPSLVVTFTNPTKLLLTEEDIKHFTYCWKKGTVYINYCHVGKPILDIFKDKDRITKGATTQTHYSADFLIKFGPSTNYFSFILRKLIINIWLIFQKFKFKNPNIGYIPVADIIKDFNIEDYRKFNKVKSVICLK
jgi:hypothetical protein